MSAWQADTRMGVGVLVKIEALRWLLWWLEAMITAPKVIRARGT